MLGNGDPSRVADLIRETAAAELLPRFRNLSKDDIRQKRPGDVVTVADVAAERAAGCGPCEDSSRCAYRGRGSGRERSRSARSDRPAGRDVLGRGPSGWHGELRRGQRHLCRHRVPGSQRGNGRRLDLRCAARAHGGGAQRAGRRARWRSGDRRVATARAPDGFVGYKVIKAFDTQLPAAERKRLGRVSTLRCAGAEYLEILSGRSAFSLYRITKPWDHAAGALMMARGRWRLGAVRRRALRPSATHQCRYHQRGLAGGAGRGEGGVRNRPDAVAGITILGPGLGFLPERFHFG